MKNMHIEREKERERERERKKNRKRERDSEIRAFGVYVGALFWKKSIFTGRGWSPHHNLRDIRFRYMLSKFSIYGRVTSVFRGDLPR